MPVDGLDARRHWDAGGFVARVARPGWHESESARFIRFDCNPLVQPVIERRSRWMFSDYAPRSSRCYANYWEAFAEADIADGLGVIVLGAGGRIANIHLGVGEAEMDAPRRRALSFAMTLLAEHALRHVAHAPAVDLTVRERDCLGFVAAGKTDWEISVILGLAQSTVRFHVDNARLKLGAVNRSQAVAKLALAGRL